MYWQLGLLLVGLVYLGFACLVTVILLEIHKKGLLFSMFIGIMWFPALILDIYYAIKDRRENG